MIHGLVLHAAMQEITLCVCVCACVCLCVCVAGSTCAHWLLNEQQVWLSQLQSPISLTRARWGCLTSHHPHTSTHIFVWICYNSIGGDIKTLWRRTHEGFDATLTDYIYSIYTTIYILYWTWTVNRKYLQEAFDESLPDIQTSLEFYLYFFK